VRAWRRWVSGGVLLAFAGTLAMHRADLSTAVRQLGTLAPAWVAVLAALATIATIANGWFAALVTDGITPGQGVLVQQATLAANNTGIGSGPVAFGVRIAMLRSWQVDDVAIGLTVVTTNVVATTKLWLVALAAAIVGAATGAASGVISGWVFTATIAAAVVVLGGSTLLWWLVLRHPMPLRWLARAVERALARLCRRSTRVERVTARFDVHDAAERFRSGATGMLRARGKRIAGAALVEQAALLALPVAIVRAFGIDDVSTAQVLITFALVRLAASLTAIPGGIGVTELGLTTLLERFGGPHTSVLAAVLTFRAITFLLPIMMGAISFAVWRRQQAATVATWASSIATARR
jgi:putative heme transporter